MLLTGCIGTADVIRCVTFGFLCSYLSLALILLFSGSGVSLPGSPPSLVVVSWLRDIMFVVFLPSRCLCLGFQCLPGVVLGVFSLFLSSALMFSV